MSQVDYQELALSPRAVVGVAGGALVGALVGKSVLMGIIGGIVGGAAGMAWQKYAQDTLSGDRLAQVPVAPPPPPKLAGTFNASSALTHATLGGLSNVSHETVATQLGLLAQVPRPPESMRRRYPRPNEKR